jgi:hypothetical protein
MTLHAGDGTINGTDDMILSSAPNSHNNTGEGDLMPSDPGAQAAGGGQGSPVDQNESFSWGNGIPTATTMSNNYHVHAFLGLYVNGQEIAIPDGIGMVNPFGDFQGTDPNAPAYCASAAPDVNFECYADLFYYIHTHTPDGLIHMEATAPICGNWQQPPAGPCPTIFTLGNVLDVWGISISPNNFGPFTGPVSIYTSPPGVFNPCSGSSGGCYTGSNTYSLYTGDPTQIPLNSHTVVWILVGSGNPTGSSLPNIEWYAAH